MMNAKIQDAINAQINAELWSAYLYLSMSADFAAKGYPGFANWMMVQFKEEQDHAMKFLNYIIQRNGVVELKPIDKVQKSWKSALDAYKDTLAHENVVTGLINNLFKIATEENDFATQSFLKWYIDEQVEEEENAQNLIDALTLIGDNGYGLYMLDKELAARVYVPLATTSSTAAV
ncbi:MAG: ferritin [Bacteroidales bacterium]|nr:ferritin [Bacteroidales bacterium]